MSSFDYEIEVDQCDAPIVCSFDYDPGEPTAFPGAQGPRCTLEAVSLGGVKLPLSVIGNRRQALEAEALEWYHGSMDDARNDAQIDRYA